MRTTYTHHFLSRRLRHTWNRIVDRNPSTKPTQLYDYYRRLYLSFFKHPRRLLDYRAVALWAADGEEECIVPLLVDRRRRTLYGFSVFGRQDYDDIVATNAEPALIRRLVGKALAPFKHYRLIVGFVNESSFLYAAYEGLCIFNENCVSIPLPDSYEGWFATLSPHQRQNIRTAYNRMSRKGIEPKLVCYDREHPVPARLWDELNIIYQLRHHEPVSRKERWRNAYYHILRRDKGCMTMVLTTADGKPMAYMAGLYSPRQRVYYIPRLCINDDYAEFSPGIVLIAETLKQIIPMGAKHLDLMRGDEPYKLAMGGTIHKNYRLDCLVEELAKERMNV